MSIPQHAPFPINMTGVGPEPDPRLVVRIICLCGDEYCDLYK